MRRSTIAGFPVEISKTWNHYDTGLEPGMVDLTPGSFDYHLKVWGDLGEVFDYPFDGHHIRWQRVAINRSGESAEYVPISVS